MATPATASSHSSSSSSSLAQKVKSNNCPKHPVTDLHTEKKWGRKQSEQRKRERREPGKTRFQSQRLIRKKQETTARETTAGKTTATLTLDQEERASSSRYILSFS